MTYYDRSHDLAVALLAAVVAQYTTDGLTPPETQFVADGLIVFDCELLAVGINRMYGVSGQPGGPAAEGVTMEQRNSWRAAQFEIICLRCSPQINDSIYEPSWAPKPSAVTASAKIVHRDAEIMTKAVIAGARSGTFGDGPQVALEGWSAIGEESGLVGGRLTVRIGLT